MRYISAESDQPSFSRARKLFGILIILACFWLLLRFYNYQPGNGNIADISQAPRPSHVVRTAIPIIPDVPAKQWLTVTVGKHDTLASILKSFGLTNRDIQAITSASHLQNQLRSLRPGQVLRLDLNKTTHTLNALEIPLNEIDTLLITRQNTKYSAELLQKELTEIMQYKHFLMGKSLVDSAVAVGIPKRVAQSLNHIFSWNTDVIHQPQNGDAVAVAYQTYTYNNQPIKVGTVIAAKFIHKGVTYAAIRYLNNNGQYDYYTPKGENLRKGMLRQPVNIGYISSPFNLHRRHPILGIVRPHTGTDFAAPYGTPIHATGDGKIIFEGWKGGYGRAVMIRHNASIITLYAHMSRFATNLHVGSSVKSWQVIGYIGCSGLCSGSHVHYEVRVNNKFRDPMKVKLPNAAPLSEQELVDFIPYAASELAKLQ